MPNAHDPPSKAQPPAQQSFLIRIWRATPKGSWHATLQRTTREPAIHFAGIDLLFAFLLMQLGEDGPPLNQAGDDEIEAPNEDPPDASL